jgi:translation initiation factor 4E
LPCASCIVTVVIEWVLWEHKSAEKKDPSKWKENMKQLCEFSTVEDFWSYFNHLPRPSEVFFDGDCRKKLAVGPEEKTVEEYSLFKKGIEPEWGDPQNVIGGEWYCRQYFEVDVLDLYWQNLVMGIVGETIEDGVDEEGTNEDHINGARVVDKSRNFPMYRLEVWVNTRDPKIKERLQKRLEEVLTDGQPPSRKMHPKFDWKDHSA